MTTTKEIAIYLATFGVFLALDAVWLGKISPKLYKNNIGHLMAKRPNFFAAAVFYGLYILGVTIFVIVPAIDSAALAVALLKGGLFGLVAYATFDLTAQAVLRNWPTKITVIDLAWGSFVTSLTAGLVFTLFN